jgi:hypothetical protein
LTSPSIPHHFGKADPLAKGKRPDVEDVVHQHAKYIGHPSQEHGYATTWAAKYLRGVFPCAILVEMNNHSGMHGKQLEVLREVTSTNTTFIVEHGIGYTGHSYSLQHRKI